MSLRDVDGNDASLVSNGEETKKNLLGLWVISAEPMTAGGVDDGVLFCFKKLCIRCVGEFKLRVTISLIEP